MFPKQYNQIKQNYGGNNRTCFLHLLRGSNRTLFPTYQHDSLFNRRKRIAFQYRTPVESCPHRQIFHIRLWGTSSMGMSATTERYG